MSTDLMTIFAHPDDETFSVGGILALSARAGKKVISISVTTQPERREEFQRACEILGIQGISLPFSSVNASNSEEIISKVIDLILEHRPRSIITHTDFDYHREHRLVHEITLEAVEWASHVSQFGDRAHQISHLYSAETVVLFPMPHLLIDISPVIETKQRAIEVYQSQASKGGTGFYDSFQFNRTRMRGALGGVTHAEALQVIPIPIVGPFKPRKVLDSMP